MEANGGKRGARVTHRSVFVFVSEERPRLADPVAKGQEPHVAASLAVQVGVVAVLDAVVLYDGNAKPCGQCLGQQKRPTKGEANRPTGQTSNGPDGPT